MSDRLPFTTDHVFPYTQTEPSAPPQKVIIVSISSHSFTMMWAPPPKGQQNGEIVSYEVEYREEGSNSTVVNTTRGMRYTAEDLTTDRVYQFRVAANTVNGTGPFSEWQAGGIIPTGKRRVAIDTISCMCASVCVCVCTFVVCVCVRMCVHTDYRHSLSVRDNVGSQASIQGAGTNYWSLTLFNTLWSFTLHDFPVPTVPFLCCSSHTHTHHTHTHAVTNLRVINTTTNSATITWDQPPHNYRVFLQGEATDNIPHSRVIQLVDVTGQTTHVVEGLNPFRNYSISVYLEFDLGQGRNATVTFQTRGRGERERTSHYVLVCLCAC